MKQPSSTALSLSLSLLLAGVATAQYPIGWRDVGLTNRGSSGSPTILARVCYPAVAAGQNTPIVQRAGGHPVVVFLHGSGSLGQ